MSPVNAPRPPVFDAEARRHFRTLGRLIAGLAYIALIVAVLAVVFAPQIAGWWLS